MSDLYPLLFEPVLKDYIWGGRNLAQKLGRSLPEDKNIAESWEIAAHPDGTAVVHNGPLAGTPLTDVLDKWGIDLVGTRSQWALDRDKFPLLIKLLDAHRNLSVQVHPDDAYAQKHEGNELGKTEMWVILHAESGAEVILGVKKDTTPAQFAAAIKEGRLEPFLHHIPVQAGDHINVPAGSLHAIMGGLLIAEIQQNSNTTYRVYDWNRRGADGNPRPLHVDRALDVINFEQTEPSASEAESLPVTLSGAQAERLCGTDYFTVERWRFEAGCRYEGSCNGATFEIWGVMAGQAAVQDQLLSAVQFVLLPAGLGAFTVTAVEDSTLLRVYVE